MSNLLISFLRLLALSAWVFGVNSAYADDQWQAGWQETASLNDARAGAAVIELDGRIYMFSGSNGFHFLTSSEFSVIQPDGTLGKWQQGTELNVDRGFPGVAAHNNYMYIVGGGNGPGGHNLLRSVERAEVLPDGRLGPFKMEKNQLNIPRRCAKAVVHGNYLYALGGFGGNALDTVERAEILPDGRLGKWQILDERLTTPRYVNAVKKSGDRIYMIGGHNVSGGGGNLTVEQSFWDGANDLMPWQQATAMNLARYGLEAAINNNYLYALGGLTAVEFTDVIEKARIDSKGHIVSWQKTTPLLMPMSNFGAVAYKDRIYILGGVNSDGYYKNVFYATLNKEGDIGLHGPAQPFKGRPQPIAIRKLPNKGTVLSASTSGSYTFINVQIDDSPRSVWIAGPRLDLEPNERIRFVNGILMKDFFSTSLKRSFAAIFFVDKVEKIDTE